MRISTTVLASILVATVSCGGTVTDGSGGGPATGSSGAGGTASTGTTSSASTGTGAGGTTVTLTMDSFPVPAGAEVYKCQDFANPFGGGDAQIAEFESHMALGSHHMLLFYKDGATNGPLEDCSGLEFAATPYSTQLPDDSLDFPAGVAALIPATTGLRVQSHYLNTTGSAITAHVEVTFHLAAPGSVVNEAGVLFVVSPINFMIQPGATGAAAVVAQDCTLPQDMNLLKAGSHMHMHGTDFIATVAGKTILHTTEWDAPAPTTFNPPDVLKMGDPLHFACTYDNNTSSVLTFGESALTNEMCIFVGSFYPVPAGQATIGCK